MISLPWLLDRRPGRSAPPWMPTARALELRVDAIVPVAMPPGRESYNIDALWARIAIELDEAKLVQLDLGGVLGLVLIVIVVLWLVGGLNV
jgi:hypothetical protein